MHSLVCQLRRFQNLQCNYKSYYTYVQQHLTLTALNQGVIAISKSYYNRCTFDTILLEREKEIFVGDSECCKNVNRTK